MDLTVRLITPGAQLSLDTLFRAVHSLEAIAHQAALDTLEEFLKSEGYNISRADIGRKFQAAQKKAPSGFRLIDARRGSWDITLGSAMGGAIGFVILEVAKELIKKNPGVAQLSDWLNAKTWTSCARKTVERLEEVQHLGHLKKEKMKVDVEADDIGAYRVNVKLELGKRDTPPIPETSVAQMAVVLPRKKKKKSKSKASAKRSGRRKRRS